jgi:parallel beta-helix repeat protein
MVVTQLRKANFFKKLLIGVGFFSIIIFLSGGDSGLPIKPWNGGGSAPSWNSAPIYISGNAQLATFCGSNGTGTSGSPYTITYAQITSAGASTAGLYINNTNTYLVIENCTVSGASGAGQSGIYLYNCSHVTVRGCTVTGNYAGIVVRWSDNVTITGNNASSNSFLGLVIFNSLESNITSNAAMENGLYGIAVSSCTDMLVSQNNASMNHNVGIALANTNQSVVHGNNVNSNTNTGIQVIQSISNRVENNTARNNTALHGILLDRSISNNVTQNMVLENGLVGIYLENADNNMIDANKIMQNTIGLQLDAPTLQRSENNVVMQNNITNNDIVGILIIRASSNSIILNNFVDNLVQAYIQPTTGNIGINNDWNNTALGNYWSDYTTQYPLASNDGITWDMPRYILNNVTGQPIRAHDHHPLVQQVKTNYLAPALTSGGVTPLGGSQLTSFTFRVTYTDSDNNAPVVISVTVGTNSFPLQKQTPSDANYQDGCVYYRTMFLQPGAWNYHFACNDTRFYNATASSSMTVTSTNSAAPALGSGDVSPGHGYNDTTVFDFIVTYTDLDNNAPAAINVTVNSTAQNATFTMAKLDPLDTNYADGCTYIASTTLHGIANYTYRFRASDGVFSVTSTTYTGLEVDHSYSIATAGMQCSYGGWIDNHMEPMDNISSVDTFGGGPVIFTVASSFVGRSINGYTRALTACSNQAFKVGAHEPMRIFTDVEIGRKVPIAVVFEANGDQEFTVTGEAEVIAMNRLFRCWILESAMGSIAYYDQNSGMLVNGTFSSKAYGGDITYSIQITSTTVTLAPNTHAPALNFLLFTPGTGTQNTLFTFRVTYTDPDNLGPVSINATINGTSYTMTKQNPADTTYTDGCVYQYSTYLQPGIYVYAFSTSDGNNITTTSTIDGPTVTLSNTHVPTLSSVLVSPLSGYNGTTAFSFTVTFTDADNNAPKSINMTINATVIPMHKVDPLDTSYTNGCLFTCSVVLNVTGPYTYSFAARDGTYSASAGPYSNIVVYRYYPILPVSGFYNYTVSTTFPAVSVNENESFSDLGGGSTNILSTWSNRTINVATREIVDNHGRGFYNGTHEPMRIFTNVQLGSTVLISVMSSGDQLFTVTGTAFLHAMGRPFECWVLESPEGSIAYYEKYSGVLVNGTFDYTYLTIRLSYSIVIRDTSIPLSPNAHDPELANVVVTPATGDQRATFRIAVIYRDLDNNASAYVRIVFDGSTYTMVKNDSGDTTYTDGCMFNKTLTYLQPGSYEYRFECSDGQFTNSTGFFTIVVTETNILTPQLGSGHVSPASGTTGPDTFTFTVTFTDFDNNAPRYVNVTLNGAVHPMAKVNASEANFMDGCVYVVSVALQPGNYSYQFWCADSAFQTNTTASLLVVAAPSGLSTEMIIAIVAVAAGIVLVAAIAGARKKKGKKAPAPKKQKDAPKAREKAAKKLPDASAPAATSVPAPGQYQAVAVPSLGRFQCPSCAKEFKFQVADLSQQYSCPDCNQLLLRLVACTRCGKPMSITQENFPKYIGKELQCPDCKNVFKV